MSRYDTIVCNYCEKEERIPAYGWISTSVPKGVTTEPEGVVAGDWCTQQCLIAHFDVVVIQQKLDGFDEQVAEVGASKAAAQAATADQPQTMPNFSGDDDPDHSGPDAPRSLYQKETP